MTGHDASTEQHAANGELHDRVPPDGGVCDVGSEESPAKVENAANTAKRVATAFGAAVGTLAATFAVLSALGVSLTVFGSAGRTSHTVLRAVDISVVRPPRMAQDERVDVTVQNAQRATVAITGVRVTVLQKAVLNECYVQGAGPSGYLPPLRTAVNLPPTAGVGEHFVSGDPHWYLSADGLQRFYVEIGATKGAIQENAPNAVRVYKLGLSIVPDQDKSGPALDDVIVSVPASPVAGSVYWTKELATSPSAIYGAFGQVFPVATLPCFRRNNALLARIATTGAVMDVDLQQVFATLAPPP